MSRHIVVIEDDADLLEVLCNALRRSGFVVTGIGSSVHELSSLIHPQAITVLRPPDVFFIDLDLRSGSPLRIVRSVCQRDGGAVTVVGISGRPSHVRAALRSNLFHAVLAKPVDLEELIGSIAI